MSDSLRPPSKSLQDLDGVRPSAAIAGAPAVKPPSIAERALAKAVVFYLEARSERPRSQVVSELQLELARLEDAARRPFKPGELDRARIEAVVERAVRSHSGLRFDPNWNEAAFARRVAIALVAELEARA